MKSAEEAFLAREGLDGAVAHRVDDDDAGGALSARFEGSPIERAKRRGLLRNVAVALGNRGSPEAVPALAVALSDEEPLVRGHAAWALGRIGTEAARQARVSETHVPDADYQEARTRFDETQPATLTLALGVIDAHNRMAVSFRRGPEPPTALPH